MSRRRTKRAIRKLVELKPIGRAERVLLKKYISRGVAWDNVDIAFLAVLLHRVLQKAIIKHFTKMLQAVNSTG